MQQHADVSPAQAETSGLAGGVVTILLSGAALGIAFNYVALTGQPPRGLAWIGEDRVAALQEMAVVGSVPGGGSVASPGMINNDPLGGIGAVGSGVPEIPALGRPVKIGTDGLRQLFDAGAALIVDARDKAEFAEGHIRGALNLPYDEVATDPLRLEGLETGGRPIVAYCGGGACELSLNLAYDLLDAGHERVAVYMEGFPDWVAGGHPVASGEAPGGAP